MQIESHQGEKDIEGVGEAVVKKVDATAESKGLEATWAVHCLWLGRGIFSHGRARMRDGIKEVKEYFVRPLMVVDGHLPCCLACFLPSQSAL